MARLIPAGRVTSYGAIAAFLGSKGAARTVGWAMNSAHGLGDVPAHRVVNRKGLLSGKHRFPGESMQERLEKEGVRIIDDQIQDFDRIFWDPMTGLNF